MSRRRTTSNLQSFSRPDVTPLVDLTFLLLIVFMITAPVLEQSLDITPPELNASAISSAENRVINLDQDGTIYLDDRLVSREALIQILMESIEMRSDVQIFIRADRGRPYGEVIEIMKLVQGVGITDVSLVTLAEEG